MAAGGEAGCKLVTDQRFIQELVNTMGSWIEAAEGQPLRLKLRMIPIKSPVSVGILEPLPRTPHVFECRRGGR